MSRRLYDRALLFLTSSLGLLLVWALGKTWRITRVGEERLRSIQDHGERVIYALWHGRMAVSIFFHRKRNIHVMVSQHRDGELISRVIERLGYEAVRGSTSSGGGRAFRKMLSKAVDRFDLAITPDGPRGPRCRAQPGIIHLAKMAGMPIVPLTSGAMRKTFLSSWDRFLLPWPFSKCVIIYGEPIRVLANCSPAELEEKRRQLERRINEITKQADLFFNPKEKGQIW